MPPWVSHLPLLSSTLHHGMILLPAADPIPYRIAQKIRAGEFVDMRYLLADNISLDNQLEDLHGQAPVASTPASLRLRLREVPSLSSWMYCFAAYMAVQTGDREMREMLAYCRLIIRKALRHGGNGWQEYDRTFRRQAAIDNSIPWNTLQPGLQAATLLGYSGGCGSMSSCHPVAKRSYSSEDACSVCMCTSMTTLIRGSFHISTSSILS